MERVVMTKRKASQQGDEVNNGDKVWVTISKNINLGNYESYKLDVGYSQTITTEHPLDMIEEIEKELSELVIEKTDAIKNKTTTRRRRRE